METGSSIDPKFEFDAPFFVNFEEVQDGVDEEDNADGWFAVNSHLERDDLLFPTTSADRGTEQGFSGNFTSSDTGATVAVKLVEQGGEGEVAAVPQTEKAGLPAVKVEGESGEEGATRLGQKRSAAAIPSLQTPALKQQRVQRGSSKKAVAAIKKILKPTVAAKTPEHLRRYLTMKKGQVKRSREELEAEEIEKMQAESRKKLREHRKTFHRLADSGKKPAKSIKHSKPTTESVGFEFRTEIRVRRRRSAAVTGSGGSRPPLPQSGVSHASKFPMTLRSASNTTITSESEGPRKTTEAKPFNFRLATRFPKEPQGEGDEKKDGYVSTAEYVFKFQAGTPERFRALPRKPPRTVYATVEDSTLQTSTSTSSSSGAGSRGLTMPFTPKLLTKNRARPTHVKSSAEIEEEELTKIRQHPIKAQLLNPKVFTGNGQVGVPKKPQHSVTQAHTPKLATKERGEARAQETSDDSKTQPPTFRAQPLPKGLFDKVLGLPKKPEAAVTCPKSPAFSLQRRTLHPNTGEEKEEEGKCHIVVAHPVPDFSRKFEPQLDHKKTEPVPFSFEERDKAKPTRASFVQMILGKEKKEPFRANPVPLFDKPCLPEVGRLPITEPRTPSLQTKIRGQEHENKWRQTVTEMIQKEKENAEFRAKDPKVLYKSPFRAKTGNGQITEVSNIILHTEVRSEQRAEFDRGCKSKEEQQQWEDRERQEAAKAEEAKRVALLRQSMVHKAQPIRHYARTVVQHSSKPLTTPRSPHFQLRQRGLH